MPGLRSRGLLVQSTLKRFRKEERTASAGDDNPYYRYKRRKFLKKFLDVIDFQSKTVLEVRLRPGRESVKHIATHVSAPKNLRSRCRSPKMLEVAAKNLSLHDVTLVKIDGASLPYPDQIIDKLVSHRVATQYRRKTFLKIVQELARVTGARDVIMEDMGGVRVD